MNRVDSEDCLIAFTQLIAVLQRAKWTDESIGMFLMGASISTLVRSGTSLNEMLDAVAEAHYEATHSDGCAN
jgi:hypothetical protein